MQRMLTRVSVYVKREKKKKLFRFPRAYKATFTVNHILERVKRASKNCITSLSPSHYTLGHERRASSILNNRHHQYIHVILRVAAPFSANQTLAALSINSLGCRCGPHSENLCVAIVSLRERESACILQYGCKRRKFIAWPDSRYETGKSPTCLYNKSRPDS